MDDPVGNLLSLLVGTVIGGVAKGVQDAHIKRQETRAVAAALRAEITVLVDGFRRRGYADLIDAWIARLSNATGEVTADDYFSAGVSETPSPVFAAHAAKLGLLGDAAEAVVRTYELAEGLALDLRHLAERHKQLPLTREQLIAFHQALRQTVNDTVTAGNVAIAQLRRRERTCWQRWRSQE